MKRFLLALVLIGLPSLAATASACVCIMTPNQTPEQIRAERVDAYNRAAAVFAGRVTDAVASSDSGQPQPTDDGSNLVGDWTGESICVGNNPNCHDENVIYHFSRSKEDARKFKLSADKVLDGKPEFMYEQDFTYDPEKKMLTGEFKNARYHGLWEYWVKGDEMEGTLSLLPDRTLGRRIKVKKVK